MWAAIGAISILAVTTGATAAYRSVGAYGHIGSNYVAKQLCSCIFVTGRTEAGCKKEFEPDITKFTVDITRKGGKADVQTRLALFEGYAQYDPKYGCSIPD
jgi:hypothetical protein